MEKVIFDRAQKMECLLDILAHKDIKGQFANDMRQLLDGAKDYINFAVKDIDYAIISDLEAVGITYVHIDTLMQSDSNYFMFLREYALKCRQAHRDKQKYLDSLSKYNKQITLMCIVDIPYFSETGKYMIIDKKNKSFVQISNHLPFTNEMLQIVQLMDTYDTVIFRTYCINEHTSKRTDVKYFIPRAMANNMSQQNVTYCSRFERIAGDKK